MMARPLAFLVALTLMLATAQAAPPPLGVAFVARAVDASGSFELNGTLGALDILGVDTTASINASGQRIDATSDFVKSYSSGAMYLQRENGTTIHSENATSADGAVFEEDYRIFIAGLPGEDRPIIRMSGQSVHLTASEQRTAAAFDLTGVREPQRVDVGDDVDANKFKGRISVIIDGSFRMVLWRVDLSIHDSTTDIALASGESQTPLAPVSGSQFVAADQEVRQVFLDIEKGNLTLGLDGGDISNLFFQDSSARVNGPLDIVLPVGESYSETGQFLAHMESNGGNLQVRLAASTDLDQSFAPEYGAPVDSPPSKTATVIKSPTIAFDYTFAFLAAIVFATLVAAALVMMRRAAAVRAMSRLESLFEAQKDHEVLRRAEPLRRSKKHRWAAGAMQLLTFARQGLYEEATEVLAWLEALPEANPEGLDYLTACVAVARGEPEVASALLHPLLDGTPEPRRPRTLHSPAQVRPRPSATAVEGYA